MTHDLSCPPPTEEENQVSALIARETVHIRNSMRIIADVGGLPGVLKAVSAALRAMAAEMRLQASEWRLAREQAIEDAERDGWVR